MCDCDTKHPGIFCGDIGCTCHDTSPIIWAFAGGGVMSMTLTETRVAILAEHNPERIYFFGFLTT